MWPVKQIIELLSHIILLEQQREIAGFHEYRISSINSDAVIIRTRKFLEKIIIFSTFNNSNMWFQ